MTAITEIRTNKAGKKYVRALPGLLSVGDKHEGLYVQSVGIPVMPLDLSGPDGSAYRCTCVLGSRKVAGRNAVADSDATARRLDK